MNRIKELRLAKGYKTQKELADHLYVNQTAVSQWERGVTMPSSQMLLKLSELFDVTVDYLIGNVNEPFFILDNKGILKDINSYGDEVEGEKKPTPGEGGGPSEMAQRFMPLVDRLTPEQQQLLLTQIQAWIGQNELLSPVAPQSSEGKVPGFDP